MSELRKLRGFKQRGDPVGPSLAELEETERLRLLKEGKKNFDPKYGGSPVFRPLNHKKRVIWQRFPRAWIYSVAFVMVASVYAPIAYVGWTSSNRSMTDIEKREAKIVNKAIDDRFANTWYKWMIFRAREE